MKRTKAPRIADPAFIVFARYYRTGSRRAEWHYVDTFIHYETGVKPMIAALLEDGLKRSSISVFQVDRAKGVAPFTEAFAIIKHRNVLRKERADDLRNKRVYK